MTEQVEPFFKIGQRGYLYARMAGKPKTIRREGEGVNISVYASSCGVFVIASSLNNQGIGGDRVRGL